MSILVIAEHDNETLKGATLNTIMAASSLDGDIDLLIAGLNIDNVIEEAQSIDELNKILVIQGNSINIPAMNVIKSRFNKILK